MDLKLKDGGPQSQRVCHEPVAATAAEAHQLGSNLRNQKGS
jgi:hypothetical protein